MRYHKKNVSLGYDYLDSTNKPSVAGLARHLNCSRQAIYDWVHSYDEFRDMSLSEAGSIRAKTSRQQSFKL